jgi:hypothetical protein
MGRNDNWGVAVVPVSMSGAPPLRPGRSGRWAIGLPLRGLSGRLGLREIASPRLGLRLVDFVGVLIQGGDGSQRQMASYADPGFRSWTCVRTGGGGVDNPRDVCARGWACGRRTRHHG